MSDKKILIPSFEAGPINLEKELDDLRLTALAEAQAGFDKSIIDALSLQQEAKHFYDLVINGLQVKGLIDTTRNYPKDTKSAVIEAINKHLLEKGIDPSTIKVEFGDCRLKYNGESVIVEDIILVEENLIGKPK